MVLVQQEAIYADHLQPLVDKVHEEIRILESIQFCFPVETIPLAHTSPQFFSTALLQLVVEWVPLSGAGAKQAMVLHLYL